MNANFPWKVPKFEPILMKIIIQGGRGVAYTHAVISLLDHSKIMTNF